VFTFLFVVEKNTFPLKMSQWARKRHEQHVSQNPALIPQSLWMQNDGMTHAQSHFFKQREVIGGTGLAIVVTVVFMLFIFPYYLYTVVYLPMTRET
jgi:hypothetical protein